MNCTKIIELEKKRKKNNKKNNEGAISIYLCLMLAVLISVILIMISAARVSAMRTHMECVTDMAMDSALSEYHKELLERYDVLFIDTAYKDKYGSLDKLSERIEMYMSYNLDFSKDLLPVIGSRDLLGLSVEDVSVLEASRATDNKGEVFKYMANTYMLERYGLGYIDNIRNLVKVSGDNKLLEGDITDEYDEALQEVDDYKYPDIEGVDWEEVDRSSPTEAIDELRRKGILELVCEGAVSAKKSVYENLATKRNLVKGSGLNSDWDKQNALETELLFTEYILLKCGRYGNVRDESYLDYQVEYIIAGKDSDIENLRDVVTKLLLMRGASNSLYFYNDEALKEEAALLAKGLSIITLCPDLEDLYRVLIEVAWIYAESVYDVKTILNGGRIPLIKASGDWKLTLDKAILMSATKMMGTTIDNNDNSKGQNYPDYLRILLYAQDKDVRTMRMLDVVEMDIRKITEDSSFCLDDCIADMRLQIIATSSYGYDLLIDRKASYW